MNEHFLIAFSASILAAAVTTVGILVIRNYDEWGRRNSTYFMCFAAGVLVSVSFLHVVPTSLEMNSNAPAYLLVGYFSMHFFNRFITAHVCDRPTTVIAPATAPAATVDVVHEYEAKGKFTDTLLGIVVIDDAWGLLVFSLLLAIAQMAGDQALGHQDALSTILAGTRQSAPLSPLAQGTLALAFSVYFQHEPRKVALPPAAPISVRFDFPRLCTIPGQRTYKPPCRHALGAAQSR